MSDYTHPSKTAAVLLKHTRGTIELKALRTYRPHMNLVYVKPNECSLTLQITPDEARDLARALDAMVVFMTDEG